MVEASASIGFSFEFALWLNTVHPTIASTSTIAAAITIPNGFLLEGGGVVVLRARVVDERSMS